MDERLRFVARLLEGEKMAPLCAEFGISRKTGIQVLQPLQGLRRPRLHGPQPAGVSPGESAPAAARGGDRPPQARGSGLGRAQFPARSCASSSTGCRTCRRSVPSMRCSIAITWSNGDAGAGISAKVHRALTPDRTECAVVCRLQWANFYARRPAVLCYPLTITDFASRYLLTCEALAIDAGEVSRSPSSSRRSKSLGCHIGDPHRQRGALCLCWHALYRVEQAVGLVATTRHSDRTDFQPGHPQQNGRHERMHLTLKREATKSAAANVLQQQVLLRHLRRPVQPESGPIRPSSMNVPRRTLYSPTHARVYRGLEELYVSVPRRDLHRDAMRPRLLSRAGR